MNLKPIYIFCLVLFVSCKEEKLAPDSLLHWVENEDNGLIITKEVGECNFKIFYQPKNYKAIKNKGDNVTKEEFQKELDELGNLHYLGFRIELNNGQPDIMKYNVFSEQDYSNRLEYFSFDIQNDLKLVQGTDTMNCVLSHFERNYGLAPYCSFSLAFKSNEEGTGNLSFIYNDSQFDVGTVKMILDENKIKNIPELIIE